MADTDEVISGSLRVIAGMDREQEFSFEGLAHNKRVTFGRHRSCDFVLNHPTVSREHFVIERSGKALLCVDNTSGNGTFVNNQRISWVELNDGDKIQAGPFVMVVDLRHSSGYIAPQQKEFAGDRDLLPTRAFTSGERHMYPWQYLGGIQEFNRGKYYEAHDIWEEMWMLSKGPAKEFYQVLIQAAVVMYHLQRENVTGARQVFEKFLAKKSALPVQYMSVDLDILSNQIRDALEAASGAEEKYPKPKAPQIVLLDTP